MIRLILHRGLQGLFEDDDASGVSPEHLKKLRNILARLDAARVVSDMRLPGLQLHPLYGDCARYWAVTVHAGWRVSFRLSKNGASDVNYLEHV